MLLSFMLNLHCPSVAANIRLVCTLRFSVSDNFLTVTIGKFSKLVYLYKQYPLPIASLFLLSVAGVNASAEECLQLYK